MERDYIKINHWLAPLSWLYGIGVAFRNWLFDIGVLEQRVYPMPVISVGNLTAGGCGKTPHVEYLVKLLHDNKKVAVLSRGYKRKSSGYVLADKDTPMPTIGDEPYQMKEKFAGIYVAVDSDRRRGIQRLIKEENTRDVEVILLDDAYQHRYVKPGLNILLVDYHRLIIYDELLPAGRLREPQSSKERADIVIVTKCPDDLKPIDYRVLKKAMALRPYQKLYFTTIAYKNLTPFSNGEQRSLSSIKADENILLLSGIASPEQIITDLAPYSNNIQTLTFADHHQFSASDIKRISKMFDGMKDPKMIITTEKDATRLRHLEGIPEAILSRLYVLPMEIEFQLGMKEEFDNIVRTYVSNTEINARINKQLSKK